MFNDLHISKSFSILHILSLSLSQLNNFSYLSQKKKKNNNNNNNNLSYLFTHSLLLWYNYTGSIIK